MAKKQYLDYVGLQKFLNKLKELFSFRSEVGELEDLKTENKDTIVDAINEVKEEASKPNVSWDELANGKIIHCDEWHPSIILPSQVELSGVKIPAKAIVGNVVSLRNITAENGIVVGDQSTSKEELQEILPESIDITLESSANLAQSLFGNGYALGAITIEGSAGVILFGEKGSDHMFLAWSPIIAPTSQTPLLSCDLVQDASLCPQDYVESSLGNNTLREDIKFLKENSGKVTWDTLGKSTSVLCDEQAVVDGEVSSKTKIPFDAPFDPSNPPTIRLTNLQALRDYYNSDNNVVYTKDEFNQAIKENGWDDMTFSYLPEQLGEYHILAESGFQFGILVKQGEDFGALINFDNEEDSTHTELLFSCEIFKDAEKCNPDYVDSSLGKANLREDIESLHLGKTTKWVDTKLQPSKNDFNLSSIPWKEEYANPVGIRFTFNGVECDSDNLPEGGSIVFGKLDYYGIALTSVGVSSNGETTLLFGYGDGSSSGIPNLVAVKNSDDATLENLWLKVEICNTISSEFVDNMPYIGYSNMEVDVTEVESSVTGLQYEKGLKLDATTFSGAISVNGEVFDITMTSGDGTLFGNTEILSGSYKEGDVPYVGMIGLDDDGKVLVIVGSVKPISSVELLQKEWRRKLPKEAIEGDDNESTDTFVAYNYLYLGNAHVEGNKLYIDNAEVVDNKIILN